MRNAEKQASVYVVYPAALFDGWEVVKERDDNPAFFNTREEAASYAKARAVMDGGAVVKLGNAGLDGRFALRPKPRCCVRAGCLWHSL